MDLPAHATLSNHGGRHHRNPHCSWRWFWLGSFTSFPPSWHVRFAPRADLSAPEAGPKLQGHGRSVLGYNRAPRGGTGLGSNAQSLQHIGQMMCLRPAARFLAALDSPTSAQMEWAW